MKKFIAIVSGLLLGAVVSANAQTTLSAVAASIANPAVVQDQSKLPDQDNRTGYLAAWLDVAALGTGSGDIDVGPYIPAGTLVVGGYVHVAQAFLPATATAVTNGGALTIQASADLLAAGTSLASTGIKYLKPSAASTFVSAVAVQSRSITTTVYAVQVDDVLDSASNIVSAVTNIVATGTVIPVATNVAVTTASTAYGAAPILVTGATSKVTFNMGAVAATSGVAFVYLDLIKVQ